MPPVHESFGVALHINAVVLTDQMRALDLRQFDTLP